MRKQLAILVVLGGCLSGCTQTGTSDAHKGIASVSGGVDHVAPGDCPISDYKYDVVPNTFTNYVKKPIVWVGSSQAIAVLFYASPANEGSTPDITIGTRGEMGTPAGQPNATKILWLVKGKPDGPIELVATNLTTGTSVTQEFEGGGNFSSVPVLPDEGCWKIRASLGGEMVLSITVRAVNFA